MQRCFFFVFLLFGGSTLSAQAFDIQHSEISYWLNDIGQDEALKAEATIKLQASENLQNLVFYPCYFNLKEVRKVEGRLKEFYDFYQRNDSLVIVNVDLKNGDKIKLHFSYQIPIQSPSYQSAYFNGEGIIGFNYFNTQPNTSAGSPGMFYPANSGDGSRLSLNITVKKGLRSFVPGQMDFMVDNEDGTISQFWNSTAEFSPEQFFMVLGDFEETDPEAIQEELPVIAINTDRLIANQVKGQLVPILSFFDGTPEYSDSTWVLIKKLSEQDLNGFYLHKSDVNQNATSFRLEKALMLYTNQNDTNRASDELLRYYIFRNEDSWRERLVAMRWDDLDVLDERDKRTTLKLRIDQWRHANQWLENFEPEDIDAGFREPLIQKLKPPNLAFSYRYISGDTAQYAYFKQDITDSTAYWIPVKFTLVTQEDSSFFFSLGKKCRGAPQAPI